MQYWCQDKQEERSTFMDTGIRHKSIGSYMVHRGMFCPREEGWPVTEMSNYRIFKSYHLPHIKTSQMD